MSYDDDMFQGTDFGKKYCKTHDIEYTRKICPECDCEYEQEEEDR